MSANINSIAWAFEEPWHKLGTRVDDLMTAEEAIVKGNLDYNVALKDVCLAPDPATPHLDGQKVGGFRATVNASTGHPFGIVGSQYTPVQNRDAFAFMDAVVQTREAKYEVVGSLGKGEAIWLLMKLNGQLRIKTTDDITNKYLLLSNRHDGRSSLRAFFTPIRVVCQNTLSRALSEGKGDGVAIRHTGDVMAKLDYAQRLLGLSVEAFEDFGNQANFLAEQQASVEWLDGYLDDLFPLNIDEEGEEIKKGIKFKAREKITDLFENAETNNLSGIAGTKWAAYNAVTEFVDHHKSPKADASKRLNRIWFGSGAKMKAKALETALG